jgi:hypothetical protein
MSRLAQKGAHHKWHPAHWPNVLTSVTPAGPQVKHFCTGAASPDGKTPGQPRDAPSAESSHDDSALLGRSFAPTRRSWGVSLRRLGVGGGQLLVVSPSTSHWSPALAIETVTWFL